MSANDTQVGGDHYKSLGQFQPWDVLRHWLTPEEYRGWMKGNAIVYLAREQQKGGDQDIGKAAHHLQKLLEVLEELRTPAMATVDETGPVTDPMIEALLQRDATRVQRPLYDRSTPGWIEGRS